LYAALDAKREHEHRSWRDVAQDLGISPSTFSRLAGGARPDVDSFVTLITWLGMDAGPFMEHRQPSSVDADPPAMISSYLRSSKKVSRDQADALDAILQVAYRSIVGESK
jgi:hypothetical protein